MLCFGVLVFFLITKGSPCTLSNRQRQLYPKVPGSFILKSLERTNPQGLVWLFKPQSITKRANKVSTQEEIYSPYLYYPSPSINFMVGSYVGAPTHKCPASISMLQVQTFKGKKEP